MTKCILQYLKGMIDYGLYYKPLLNFRLIGYIDSNWASDIDNEKSTSTYTFNLGSTTIAWNSKK